MKKHGALLLLIVELAAAACVSAPSGPSEVKVAAREAAPMSKERATALALNEQYKAAMRRHWIAAKDTANRTGSATDWYRAHAVALHVYKACDDKFRFDDWFLDGVAAAEPEGPADAARWRRDAWNAARAVQFCVERNRTEE